MSEGTESTVFEAMVSASSGQAFVQMTCALNEEAVFAVKLSPAVATALGLRAIQAAIEAERDAGLVAFVYDELAAQMGLESRREVDGLVGMLLVGLREHRAQFDSEAGSMRPLSGDDPSSLS